MWAGGHTNKALTAPHQAIAEVIELRRKVLRVFDFARRDVVDRPQGTHQDRLLLRQMDHNGRYLPTQEQDPLRALGRSSP